MASLYWDGPLIARNLKLIAAIFKCWLPLVLITFISSRTEHQYPSHTIIQWHSSHATNNHTWLPDMTTQRGSIFKHQKSWFMTISTCASYDYLTLVTSFFFFRQDNIDTNRFMQNNTSSYMWMLEFRFFCINPSHYLHFAPYSHRPPRSHRHHTISRRCIRRRYCTKLNLISSS